MEPINPRPWTHWANHSEKRLFLVVDVTDEGTVVIMEIKEYNGDEKRIFKHVISIDWMILTQDKQLLKPYTPKI